MAIDRYTDTLARYLERFDGEPPLEPWGVTEDKVLELMERALARGTPIGEDEYLEDLPGDAEA